MTAAVTLLLVAIGLGGIGWAAAHQESAPQPGAGAAGTVTPSSPAAPPTAQRPAGRPPVAPLVLPASTPKALTIPAIGVHSTLLALGLGRAGALAVPPPGPHYDQAAWFDGSPTPGQLGPAVIEGHVDSRRGGRSVFFALGALRPGAVVEVPRADGIVAEFRVDGVRRYAKDAFPTTVVFGGTPVAALRLITCGGSFDRVAGHYLDNVVVFAHLVGSRAGA